jgi:hypothetical protein
LTSEACIFPLHKQLADVLEESSNQNFTIGQTMTESDSTSWIQSWYCFKQLLATSTFPLSSSFTTHQANIFTRINYQQPALLYLS